MESRSWGSRARADDARISRFTGPLTLKVQDLTRAEVLPPLLSRLLLVLLEVDRISQVRVSFKKVYLLNFVGMATGVTQDEQSIANVNDVDRPIPVNGIAPHDDLRLEVGIRGTRVEELVYCRCRS